MLMMGTTQLVFFLLPTTEDSVLLLHKFSWSYRDTKYSEAPIAFMSERLETKE